MRHRRARRYVLRLQAGGVARVTVPRGGSLLEAQHFAERNVAWLEDQLLKQASLDAKSPPWTAGTEILFRGAPALLTLDNVAGHSRIRFADQAVPVANDLPDHRAKVERHLWHLARHELPTRVFEIAGQHRIAVQRVTVRNQRSRWGSCSRRGTVSLNWRLIQAPPLVRDYLILHELAHLRHMNHSPEFWHEVARLCPGWTEAERWLKDHAHLLARPHRPPEAAEFRCAH